MRKAWLALAVLAGMAAPAKAYDFWSLVKDQTVVASSTWTFSTAVTSTATILIDLSDTTNWPHKKNRQINISSIRMIVDKAAAGTFAARVGVVTFVDVSSGSVTWFWHLGSGLNVSNTANSQLTTGEYFYKCRVNPLVPVSVAEGTTPFIISNSKTLGSTVYQTDVPLPSLLPVGPVFPGVGDIVMDISKGSTLQSLQVEIAYHAE